VTEYQHEQDHEVAGKGQRVGGGGQADKCLLLDLTIQLAKRRNVSAKDDPDEHNVDGDHSPFKAPKPSGPCGKTPAPQNDVH